MELSVTLFSGCLFFFGKPSSRNRQPGKFEVLQKQSAAFDRLFLLVVKKKKGGDAHVLHGNVRKPAFFMGFAREILAETECQEACAAS